MKNLAIYINTMYPAAFRVLSIGLAIFSLSLILLATSLRGELLAGESDIIYRYPDMIEKILFPIYILIPITTIIDLNERKKGREK